jgi:hypothetical protein
VGPLIAFVLLAAVGLPFVGDRGAWGRAYAASLLALGALALTQTAADLAPERILLSHTLQLAVTMRASEGSPFVGLGLFGAAMFGTSPRRWAAVGLGLCAALSLSPAFTALCLGLCAFGLGDRLAPAAWIAALGLWAGIWAGEGSPLVVLLLGVGLVWSVAGGPEERVAALVAAGLFTAPGAALTQTGEVSLVVTAAVIGRAAWTGSPWMATLGVGLTLASLGESGLGLCVMAAGLLPEPHHQAPQAPLSAASAVVAVLTLLVLAAGLGPAPAILLPVGVGLWALLRRRPPPSVWSLLGPTVALGILLWRWGRP